jgi:hypothetical protein
MLDSPLACIVFRRIIARGRTAENRPGRQASLITGMELREGFDPPRESFGLRAFRFGQLSTGFGFDPIPTRDRSSQESRPAQKSGIMADF